MVEDSSDSPDSPDYKTLFLEQQRELRMTTLPEFLHGSDIHPHPSNDMAQDSPDSLDSPDYKNLYLEEQRQKREEQRQKRELQEQLQEQQRELRMTTLPEVLHGSNIHPHLSLANQTDQTKSTKGDPANAKNKVRPERIRVWEDFPQRQETIWNKLVQSDFIRERHFTSMHTLREIGKPIAARMISSELDLYLFQRNWVYGHVTSIVQQLYQNSTLRTAFQLEGTVGFENHSNTLTPEQQLDEDLPGMSVSGKRRRSPRFPVRDEQSSSHPSTISKTIRPRADQFCAYNTEISQQRSSRRVAAFVVDYKAPHKLKLGYIYEGLRDMDLDEVVRCGENDSAPKKFRRLIAAIITQAFSYMVQAGLEYGCICTGEATIFLRVPEDPSTVYYYLSVPKGDVGESTGWSWANLNSDNRLHLTAIGQMLAFTLQATKTPPRSNRWQNKAMNQLKTWEVVYDDLLKSIPVHHTMSPEYLPSRHTGFLRTSPIRLGSKALLTTSSCDEQEGQCHISDEDHDPDPDADTPSRSSRSYPTQSVSSNAGKEKDSTSGSHDSSDGWHHTQQSFLEMPYCTHECLRGLKSGGALDKECPNWKEHGIHSHQISQSAFLDLIRCQLDEDLDANFEPIGIPGSRGIPFKVRLASHGYTLFAKCTPEWFVRCLSHEADVYDRLGTIQGGCIPVHLGNIDLKQPYRYEGFIMLAHVMFLSFGGDSIDQHIPRDIKTDLAQQVERAIEAIHQLNVLHRDVEARNILWNPITRQVVVTDFERAKIFESRIALGNISPQRVARDNTSKQASKDVFWLEMNKVRHELTLEWLL